MVYAHKKRVGYATCILLIFLLIPAVIAGSPDRFDEKCKDSTTGAIMAQHANGSTGDYFEFGENVYLKTNNLGAGTYWWRIIDENKNILATGGPFSVPPDLNLEGPLWAVPLDSEAKAHFRLQIVNSEECLTEDNKFFVKNDTLNSIPEFTSVAIPGLVALGGYMTFRRRRKR